MPQHQDKARQQAREQLVDALLREASMSRERTIEMDRNLQELIAISEKDGGCSSGGTDPSQATADGNEQSAAGSSVEQTIKLSAESLCNKIGVAMQLSIWSEEVISERFSGDSKGLNYRTMIRRLTQQLKQKEELKSTLMTCADQESVNNFIAEFASQKGGVPSAASNSAQSSPAKDSAVSAGGAATSQPASQSPREQAEEAKIPTPPPPQSSQSPFGAPKPGAPRGGPKTRGGPRFAPPRFPLPQATAQSSPSLSSGQDPSKPSRIAPPTNSQNVDSGSADDSTFFAPQPEPAKNEDPLDFLDSLNSKPAVTGLAASGDEQPPHNAANDGADFLQEFLHAPDTQEKKEAVAEEELKHQEGGKADRPSIDLPPNFDAFEEEGRMATTFGESEERPDFDRSSAAQGEETKEEPVQVNSAEQGIDQLPGMVRFESIVPNRNDFGNQRSVGDHLSQTQDTISPIQVQRSEPSVLLPDDLQNNDQTGNGGLQEIVNEAPEPSLPVEEVKQMIPNDGSGETGSQQSSQLLIQQQTLSQQPAPPLPPQLQQQSSNDATAVTSQDAGLNRAMSTQELPQIQIPTASFLPTSASSSLLPPVPIPSSGRSPYEDNYNSTQSEHARQPTGRTRGIDVMVEEQSYMQSESKRPKVKKRQSGIPPSSGSSKPSKKKREPADSQAADLEKFFYAQQTKCLPPESVASSVPMTAFEDVQQMARAYKKKKREIVKLKEQVFKLEQENLVSKQRAELADEELTACQKRLARVERQVKQGGPQQKQNTGGWDEVGQLAQRQLQLKAAEHEATQTELNHQKGENQRLREKVRELLKKVATVAGATTSQQTIYQESGASNSNFEQEKRMLEQGHQLELVRQREQKNLEIRQLQDELKFSNERYDRLQQEAQTSSLKISAQQSDQDRIEQNCRREWQIEKEQLLNRLKIAETKQEPQNNEQQIASEVTVRVEQKVDALKAQISQAYETQYQQKESQLLEQLQEVRNQLQVATQQIQRDSEEKRDLQDKLSQVQLDRDAVQNKLDELMKKEETIQPNVRQAEEEWQADDKVPELPLQMRQEPELEESKEPYGQQNATLLNDPFSFNMPQGSQGREIQQQQNFIQHEEHLPQVETQLQRRVDRGVYDFTLDEMAETAQDTSDQQQNQQADYLNFPLQQQFLVQKQQIPFGSAPTYPQLNPQFESSGGLQAEESKQPAPVQANMTQQIQYNTNPYAFFDELENGQQTNVIANDAQNNQESSNAQGFGIGGVIPKSMFD